MKRDEAFVEEFDDLLRKLGATNDIGACIDLICEQCGIDHGVYYYSVHDGMIVQMPYVKTNYPAAWIRQYVLMNYIEVDPVLTGGFKRSEPCRWDEIDWSGEAAQKFRADAIAHGIGQSGYVIPITDRRQRRAILSLNSSATGKEWDKKVAKYAPLWVECAEILHMKAINDMFGPEDDHPALSPRERECLAWVAQGKDAISIASILKISEHTVRDYCKSAKLKLGCATLFQAIHKATLLRLIDVDIPNDSPAT